MRRVLMISPHYPPDSTAATHRVRLLAPHLPRKLVRETEKMETQEEVNRILDDLHIPLRDMP